MENNTIQLYSEYYNDSKVNQLDLFRTEHEVRMHEFLQQFAPDEDEVREDDGEHYLLQIQDNRDKE